MNKPLTDEQINSVCYMLNTPTGQLFLEDLRHFSQIDEPFGEDISNDHMRYRAAWQDAFNYINTMASSHGE